MSTRPVSSPGRDQADRSLTLWNKERRERERGGKTKINLRQEVNVRGLLCKGSNPLQRHSQSNSLLRVLIILRRKHYTTISTSLIDIHTYIHTASHKYESTFLGHPVSDFMLFYCVPILVCCCVRLYVHGVQAVSFFLSFLVNLLGWCAIHDNFMLTPLETNTHYLHTVNCGTSVCDYVMLNT